MRTRFLTHAAAWTMTVLVAATLLPGPALEAAESAHSLYTRALGRERELRDAANRVTVLQIRRVVAAYEGVVRRYPRSGYSDNALWQGANLALLAFERFRQPADRQTALRLLEQLRTQYPSSSLVERAADAVRQVETARAAPAPAPPAAKAAPRAAVSTPPAPPPLPAVPQAAVEPPAALPTGLKPSADPDVREAPPSSEEAAASVVTIRDIRRTDLPDGVRISIEMDGESLYRTERLENPRRVFFDLKNTRTVISLQDATVKFGDDIVREVRFGRHPRETTRIVMDLEDVEDYSVFTLYSPFRLVVDFRRSSTAARPASPPAATSSDVLTAAAKEPVPLIARPIAPAAAPPLAPPPASPATNANGQFSIARQLGLGVSRIVLDAGHGGHDPGAKANGISESELVLDVTLRLRALLEKQPGMEVTLTRDKDVFVPLEERTAIANREGADLFLSIHANASRNTNARGIETYFLNFASNREAEAVAARENSASGRTMHSLPTIVRAIALNNKIDESRDFASMVQQSMVKRLTARNKDVRDLGVKQAPFVVLIGASMPSVLAEISFVTHREEAALLKSPAYRQQIAESLLEGVLRYQRSLKGVRAIAALE